MRPLPLRLTLEPLLPTRMPSHGDSFEYGFHLRLPDGPVLERGDPLLAAYGAAIEWIEPDDEHEEQIQSATFDPGSRLTLRAEPFDPRAPDDVGVWDADGVRQAGVLGDRASAVATAALDAGLDPAAIVLREYRGSGEDRRERLAVLLHSPRLARVSVPRGARFLRPERPARPRLVLVADGRGEVRWWDPTGSRGPLEADALPLSPDLRVEIESLREGFAELAGRAARGFPFEMVRSELDDRAAELWCRARFELAPSYAVGFLGRGMRSPAWSPRELYGPDGDDDDIPF